MAARATPRIATAEEVLEYLTGVQRGEIGEKVPVTGADGVTELVEVPARIKERTRAAELLGKRYGLFTERIEVSDTPRIVDDIADVPDG